MFLTIKDTHGKKTTINSIHIIAIEEFPDKTNYLVRLTDGNKYIINPKEHATIMRTLSGL